jgi:hypothetical protein
MRMIYDDGSDSMRGRPERRRGIRGQEGGRHKDKRRWASEDKPEDKVGTSTNEKIQVKRAHAQVAKR